VKKPPPLPTEPFPAFRVCVTPRFSPRPPSPLSPLSLSLSLFLAQEAELSAADASLYFSPSPMLEHYLSNAAVLEGRHLPPPASGGGGGFGGGAHWPASHHPAAAGSPVYAQHSAAPALYGGADGGLGWGEFTDDPYFSPAGAGAGY
jgi:hypothetical protein